MKCCITQLETPLIYLKTLISPTFLRVLQQTLVLCSFGNEASSCHKTPSRDKTPHFYRSSSITLCCYKSFALFLFHTVLSEVKFLRKMCKTCIVCGEVKFPPSSITFQCVRKLLRSALDFLTVFTFSRKFGAVCS